MKVFSFTAKYSSGVVKKLMECQCFPCPISSHGYGNIMMTAVR